MDPKATLDRLLFLLDASSHGVDPCEECGEDGCEMYNAMQDDVVDFDDSIDRLEAIAEAAQDLVLWLNGSSFLPDAWKRRA